MHVQLSKLLPDDWVQVTAVRAGEQNASGAQPDKHVLVADQERPYLRIEVFGSEDDHGYTFEDAVIWGGSAVIGFGNRVHFVNLLTQEARSIDLRCYFGSFCPTPDVLLVASAARVLRFDREGRLAWQSEPVGLDGVIISHADSQEIHGQGEWDPPGGWEDFRLSMTTGARLDR